MSKFKGTPGPWSTVGTMTLYVETRIPGGLIQEVAAVGPTEADGGYGEKQRANARLIAAAPKLLDAAIMTIEHYDAYFCGSAPDDLPWVPVMRKAIKEALGEDAT